MKTAMQELRDDLIQIFNDNNIPIILQIILQIDKYLEKEKEQIKDAHCWGWSDAYDNLEYNKSRLCEEYYKETYNQKQHIIDIMKADEDDGLYKQIK